MHGTLRFPEFISPIVWNMCEHLHYEIGIFQRATQREYYYCPTTYREGAAVVSTTITSINYYIIDRNKSMDKLKSSRTRAVNIIAADKQNQKLIDIRSLFSSKFSQKCN